VLSEFNILVDMLFPDLVSWIFVKCSLSITRLPVLYKTHLSSSFSLDKIPKITVDLVCFADEASNIKNELTNRPTSFLPSKRLKNPFNESMITSDFVFEIFSITDFRSSR